MQIRDFKNGSPFKIFVVLMYIKQMADVGSQFIIVTHSPILLGLPGADIISFDDGEVHRIQYEETESYQVMEMFINNREQLLHGLFDESED